MYRELLATEACGDLNTANGREILRYVEDAYRNMHRLQERADRYSFHQHTYKNGSLQAKVSNVDMTQNSV